MIAAISRRFQQIALISVTTLMVGCSEQPDSAASSSPSAGPAVNVVKVSRQTVPEPRQFAAHTEAADSVQLRARVEGVLIERSFSGGAEVEAGQLLFRIDPAPFKAALKEEEAQVMQADAEKKRAEAAHARDQKLFASGHLSREKKELSDTVLSKATAAQMAAKARLEMARLTLSHTEITAPFAGVAGEPTYSTGTLVGPGSKPLAVLLRVDPIEVVFHISEQEFLNYRQSEAGQGQPDEQFGLSLLLPNGRRYPLAGRFDFADVRIDQQTGLLAITAQFPNPQHVLLPGLHVTLVVEQRSPPEYILVPQAAVQESREGRSVLVVGDNGTVAARTVFMGDRKGPMWVVESGLLEGETVIVEGLQKVRPGGQVKPVLADIDPITGQVLQSDSEQPQ